MEQIEKTEKQQAFHNKMLADCQAVLKHNKLTPILTGSALLGYMRTGDLLTWYPPGSVFIIRYHEIKSEQHEQKIYDDLINSGFEIIKYFKKKNNWKITVRRDIFLIEITGFYKDGKNYARNNTKHRIKTIPKRFLSKFQKIEIRGTEYICPFEIENYLSHLYTDWKTPIKTGKRGELRNKAYSRFTK